MPYNARECLDWIELMVDLASIECQAKLQQNLLKRPQKSNNADIKNHLYKTTLKIFPEILKNTILNDKDKKFFENAPDEDGYASDDSWHNFNLTLQSQPSSPAVTDIDIDSDNEEVAPYQLKRQASFYLTSSSTKKNKTTHQGFTNILQDLQSFAYLGRLVFLDLETTGLLPDARIAQIGIIEVNFIKEDVKILNEWMYPGDNTIMSEEATNIHGKTLESLQQLPTLPYFWNDIEKYLTNATIVGFNSWNFDLQVLKNEAQRYNLTPIQYTQSIDIGQFHWFNFKRDLAHAYNTYTNKILVNHHSAEADCMACVEILAELCINNKIPCSTDEIENFITENQRQFIFKPYR